MILFCPSCGRRLEVPDHLEADAAHKCPFCNAEFGGEEAPPPATPEPAAQGRDALKFVSGGETAPISSQEAGIKPGTMRREHAQLAPGIVRKEQKKVEPSQCEVIREWGPSKSQGAGLLFEAKDPSTGELLVLRNLLPAGGSIADAERWATASSRLQTVRHPRLVSVLGVGLKDGVPWAAVEFAAGQTLGSPPAPSAPFSVKRAMQVAQQIVEALAAAHTVGAVHGNLKPSNVVLSPAGEARCMDFGLAPRALEAGKPLSSEHVIGWLPFAAPECVSEGPDRANERSDTYGLGALMYFMLTGLPPFSAEDPEELLSAVLKTEPRPPGAINRRIPAELDALVMTALNKDPLRRRQSVQAMGVELRNIEKAQTGFFSKFQRHRLAQSRRWHRVVFVTLLLLGGAGYGTYWYVSQARIARGRARAEDLVKEAKDLETKGDLEAATARYGQAVGELRGSPDEGEKLLDYAALLLRAGRPEEAAEVYGRVAGFKERNSSEAKARRPGALARAGKIEEARAAWEALSVRSRNEKGRKADKAAFVRQQGWALESAASAVGWLVEQGEHKKALELAGVAEGLPEVFGKPAAAGKSARTEKFGRQLQLFKSRALLALGRLPEARAELGKILRSGAASPGEKARAAEELVGLIDMGRAEPTDEELEAIRRHAKALIMLARIYVAGGELGKIDLAGGGPIPSDPKGLEAQARVLLQLALGERSEAQGDFEEARRSFEGAALTALTLKEKGIPALADAKNGLARLLLREGRAGPALAAFRAVREQFADMMSAHPEPRQSSSEARDKRAVARAAATAAVWQGDALRLLDRPDQAARTFREFLSAYPGRGTLYLEALSKLGEVATETRAREEARGAWQKLAEAPGGGVFRLIGRVMLEKAPEGDLIGAVLTERRRDLAAKAFYCLGLRREAADEPGPARAYFRKARERAGKVSWYSFLAERRMEVPE